VKYWIKTDGVMLLEESNLIDIEAKKDADIYDVNYLFSTIS